MALILASTAGSEVYTSFEDIGLATVIIAEPEQFQGSKNLIAIRNELSLKGSSQMRPKRSDMNKSQFLYSFHAPSDEVFDVPVESWDFSGFRPAVQELLTWCKGNQA